MLSREELGALGWTPAPIWDDFDGELEWQTSYYSNSPFTPSVYTLAGASLWEERYGKDVRKDFAKRYRKEQPHA